MPRLNAPVDDGPWIHRIMAYCPQISAKWNELDVSLRTEGIIDAEMKEQIRRSLAPGVGCQFCVTVAGPPSDHLDERTSLAISYAQLLRQDPTDIDDSAFDLLREQFTEQEIAELSLWILYAIAYQSFGAVMQVPPATAEETDQYRQYREQLARISG